MNVLELGHVGRIQHAIEMTIAGEKGHGSFVSLMAKKDYGRAAFHADSTMGDYFCEMVQWRERLNDYEVKNRLEGRVRG
jgi:hypothetical protein